MIPRRIFRVVPERTTVEVEDWWDEIYELHPGWELITYRDPISPARFPLTSPSWDLSGSGAQFAGLIRLEALLQHGGIYLDSDVSLFRSLDPLLNCSAFAAWEDEQVVPDAVLASEPNHPAIRACLELALERLRSDSSDWRIGPGAWATGPGVTTTVLPQRPDVLLLPPETFYPVHYTVKQDVDTRAHTPKPWTFGIHHWAASWV